MARLTPQRVLRVLTTVAALYALTRPGTLVSFVILIAVSGIVVMQTMVGIVRWRRRRLTYRVR